MDLKPYFVRVEGLPDLRRDKLLVLHLTPLLYLLFVRVEGLEPPSLAALDPKSSVSTNFTTPAFGRAKLGNLME